MFRKIAFLFVALALLTMTAAAYADPIAGCYLSSSAATIKEGQPVTITALCNGIPTESSVFGFQLKTALSGNGLDLPTVPATYTPAITEGGFASDTTGAASPLFYTLNSLSDFYAAVRANNEVVTMENFTLGSYILNANESLTADGSIIVTFVDEDFMLTNDEAQTVTGNVLRDINDVEVTVTNLDLAWLNGNIIVQSDFSAIADTSSISLVLGQYDYNIPNETSGPLYTFPILASNQYSEGGSPTGNGTLNITVNADMSGHLACTTANVNLGDAGGTIAASTKVGNAGTITLKAGDANNDAKINNTDATAIGANFDQTPSGELDINGDGALNVLDLVFVSRNFGIESPTSCNV